MALEGATYEEIKAMFEEYIAYAKEVKVLDIVMQIFDESSDEAKAELEEMVTEAIAYIGNIFDKVNVTINADSEFNVKNMNLSVNLTKEDIEHELIPEMEMMPEVISVNYTLLVDYPSKYDLSSVKAEIENFKNSLAQTNNESLMNVYAQKLFSRGYEPKQVNSKTIFVYDDVMEVVLDQGELNSNQYYRVAQKQTFYSEVDPAKFSSYITQLDVRSRCGSWYEFDINMDLETTITISTVQYVYDKSTNQLVSETVLETQTEKQYDDAYFWFYYNTTTKQAATTSYGNKVEHNFVEDLSQYKEAQGCTGIGRHVEVCTQCGQTRVDFYTNGHNEYLVEYTLKDGVSCEGGLDYVVACHNCDYTYSGHTDYHKTFYTRYELNNVCGGYLQVGSCACKEYHWVNMEVECDFEYHSEYNEATDSWTYYYHCAVSEPLCGFNYAVTREMISDPVNACKYTEYEVYYLGITGNDLSTAKQVVKIDNGTTYDHDYQRVDSECINTETLNKYVERCTHCTASYETVTYYQGGYPTKHTETRIQPENDQKVYYEYNYVLYNTGKYDEYGTEYVLHLENQAIYKVTQLSTSNVINGYTTTYRYNFDGQCTKYVTTVYNDGDNYSDSYICCNSHGHIDSEYHYGSCTQDYYEYRICRICNTELESIQYGHGGHDWYWDAELEIYVCYDCGLKSVTGVDGSIVLEDATDYENNPNQIKIGYYNEKGMEFIVTVSLMLNEPEDGQDDQVVLDNVYIWDAYEGRYKLFYYSDVVEMAEALGYAEGTYSVRITFVPVNQGDSFDYSITLE